MGEQRTRHGQDQRKPVSCLREKDKAQHYVGHGQQGDQPGGDQDARFPIRERRCDPQKRNQRQLGP